MAILVDMKIFTAKTRKRMSEAAKRRCTPEWRRAMSNRLIIPLPQGVVEGLYALGHTQAEIAKQLGVSQKAIWGFMRRLGLKARVAAKRDQRGSKNHQWKGDEASYSAMHNRLYSKFGKPKRCDECGTVDERKAYDWANLTGEYGDITDYRRLCRSCHCKYDKSRRSPANGE